MYLLWISWNRHNVRRPCSRKNHTNSLEVGYPAITRAFNEDLYEAIGIRADSEGYINREGPSNAEVGLNGGRCEGKLSAINGEDAHNEGLLKGGIGDA